ncbi:MAG TPA: hypothetical protein GXX20_05035 [Clostridiaceae bacterium]|nr:hypothetical protein [Clostridiaceae bacterium]
MAFESLSYRYTYNISNFPQRWLPLIHLYDPDLPLFPIYYFHVLPEGLTQGVRPTDTQRAFGYVEKVNLNDDGSIDATIVTNKDLTNPINRNFINPVQRVIKERFGIQNPVLPVDIQNAFTAPFTNANNVLFEIWQRVVSNAYGDILPFGRLWDEVLGLVRFVSSWYSSGGRKGELIQTHYFVSKFGVKIQSAGGIPQVDFYLLPTIGELTDSSNPLTSFPWFAKLVNIARIFQSNYCTQINIGGMNLSKFNNPTGRQFNTEGILSILQSNNIPFDHRPQAIECYNTFDKGPMRTVIFLMMLDDIRNRRYDPSVLNSSQCGSIYDGLKRASAYQSPKVIQIYAQQSFGNASAMPVDTWIDTFFKWPLNIYPTGRSGNKYGRIFSHSQNLGKVERLLWVAGQARKVHSSACNDALWCLKYSSEGKPRGANPLACNICIESIRNSCPAYMNIRNRRVCFNTPGLITGTDFLITTSSNNNTTPNQSFTSCQGNSIYEYTMDDFSPADSPNGFTPYPAPGHNGSIITVEQFVQIY